MKCTRIHAVICLIQAILLGLVIFTNVRMHLEKQESIIQVLTAVIIAVMRVIRDNFLVPPKKVILTTKFLREGIKYNELSEEEKAQYEE